MRNILYILLFFSSVSFGQISITASWDNVARIEWAKQSGEYYYIVTQNGVRIGKTATTKFYAHYLEKGNSYTFEVLKVDANDVESSVGTATTVAGSSYDTSVSTPKIIDAATVSPFYSVTDATLCYRNAIRSASEGDIVHFKTGSGDNHWRVGNMEDEQFTNANTSDYITILIDAGLEFNAIENTWVDGLSMLARFDRITGLRIIGYGAKFYLRSTLFGSGYGQSKMSIAFYNSKQCSVEGLTLDGSGGDGIYYGNLGQNDPNNIPVGYSIANTDMLVYNVLSKNHKRQAYSYDSVDGSYLIHSVADSTGNHIDPDPNLFNIGFENNHSKEALSNNIIRYVSATAAYYSNIGFNITKMGADSPHLTVTFKDVATFSPWQQKNVGSTGNYSHGRAIHASYGAPGGTGLIKYERVAMFNAPFSGFGYVQHPDRIEFHLQDVSIVNPSNYSTNTLDQYYAIDIQRTTIGSGKDHGDITADNLFIYQPTLNQPSIRFRGASADTYNLDDVNITNLTTVSSYAGASGTYGAYRNTPTKPEGTNFFIGETLRATPESATVSISKLNDATRGGQYGYIRVSRDAVSISALPVNLNFSGAEAMNDYDYLPPAIVIPGGHLFHDYPIKARYKNKSDQILNVSIEPSSKYVSGGNYYSVGSSNSVSVNIGSTAVAPSSNIGGGKKQNAINLINN